MLNKLVIINSFFKRITLIASLLILCSLAIPTNVQAAVYLYSLGTSYSGTAPSGPSPWVTATFTDVAPNAVQLQLSTPNLSGTEFVGGWYFNFDPNANVSNLTITPTSGAPPGTPTISTGTNAFKADGGGYYDIAINFPESGNRFTANELATYNITSSDSLNAGMFDFASIPSGGNGTWYSSAHVQNTGNGQSAFIGATAPSVSAPEPSTYLIIGSFAAFSIYLKKRLDRRTVTKKIN